MSWPAAIRLWGYGGVVGFSGKWPEMGGGMPAMVYKTAQGRRGFVECALPNTYFSPFAKLQRCSVPASRVPGPQCPPAASTLKETQDTIYSFAKRGGLFASFSMLRETSNLPRSGKNIALVPPPGWLVPGGLHRGSNTWRVKSLGQCSRAKKASRDRKSRTVSCINHSWTNAKVKDLIFPLALPPYASSTPTLLHNSCTDIQPPPPSLPPTR